MTNWLPWRSSGSSDSDKPPAALGHKVEHASRDIAQNADDLAASLYARAAALPPHILVLTAFILGGTAALGANYVYARNFRRIANGEWVTPEMLARRRWIKGYVTRYCMSTRYVHASRFDMSC